MPGEGSCSVHVPGTCQHADGAVVKASPRAHGLRYFRRPVAVALAEAGEA